MKYFITAMALVSSAAYANFSETKTVHVTSAGAINLVCVPGFAPDGHSFPRPLSPSRLELRNVQHELSTANVTTAAMTDPSGLAGNYCQDLMNEVEGQLPGDLVITRTLNSQNREKSGACARVTTENIEARLGALVLTGATEFTEETLSAASCGL